MSAKIMNHFLLSDKFGYWASLIVGGLADFGAIATAGVLCMRASKAKDNAGGAELDQAKADYGWSVTALIIFCCWTLWHALQFFAYRKVTLSGSGNVEYSS